MLWDSGLQIRRTTHLVSHNLYSPPQGCGTRCGAQKDKQRSERKMRVAIRFSTKEGLNIIWYYNGYKRGAHPNTPPDNIWVLWAKCTILLEHTRLVQTTKVAGCELSVSINGPWLSTIDANRQFAPTGSRTLHHRLCSKHCASYLRNNPIRRSIWVCTCFKPVLEHCLYPAAWLHRFGVVSPTRATPQTLARTMRIANPSLFGLCNVNQSPFSW